MFGDSMTDDLVPISEYGLTASGFQDLRLGYDFAKDLSQPFQGCPRLPK